LNPKLQDTETSLDSIKDLVLLIVDLEEHAQNNEMINQFFTEHGHDCLDAVKYLRLLLDDSRFRGC
jgi:cupin superfamily acireductone dioxygenase involved in methionine salvage